MKTLRYLWMLTIFNLGLLLYQAIPPNALAGAGEQMLRGSGLEIIDSAGKVRFQIQVLPANPEYKWPDSAKVGIPETVILRMSTADGKPRVKLATSMEGSGLMLLGDSDTTQSILQADEKQSSLKLRNDEKTQQLFKP